MWNRTLTCPSSMNYFMSILYLDTNCVSGLSSYPNITTSYPLSRRQLSYTVKSGRCRWYESCSRCIKDVIRYPSLSTCTHWIPDTTFFHHGYLFTTDMVLWTRDEKLYQVLHVRYRYMWLKDMIPRVPVPQVGDTLGSMSLSHRYCWIRTCNTKSIFLEVHVLGTAWLNMYQEPGPQERRYSCNCMSRFVS